MSRTTEGQIPQSQTRTRALRPARVDLPLSHSATFSSNTHKITTSTTHRKSPPAVAPVTTTKPTTTRTPQTAPGRKATATESAPATPNLVPPQRPRWDDVVAAAGRLLPHGCPSDAANVRSSSARGDGDGDGDWDGGGGGVDVLTLGDPGTGKTCLLRRFCDDVFVEDYVPTIGIDFGVKSVDLCGNTPHGVERTMTVNFFDLSGQSKYFDVRNEFYPDAQAILLVFDLGSQSSFDSLILWLSEAKANGLDLRVPIVLVGNKEDIAAHPVPENQIEDWIESQGITKYFPSSAATGMNVQEAFHCLLQTIAT
ncbi:GTP-binding protein [Pelomyxa schiedti]|nr:GTP-binding protein [Pelomyxa schiedti]